ncbi:TetR/AcrR family transcriptional regulator [Streptomyces sp. NA04227]|uniref:TetR/AcrR family transcriptional regulator n=1 Tax=Streptomyces sp. NA04227 TaxID=2742136 RepID=UPI00158FBDA5|nr:TetR/AcrR family transcriptional regulator [Streptomyces sp. NA04227]QKW10634.1 TetR/AcrR family transcriptional regulator [Streptomyces sp. NA04227]
MKCVQHSTSLRRAPVQQRSAERLSRILDACASLLDEVGYEDLSTRAVAVRAQVPIGSVYRFFGNKRAMVEALAERNLADYGERVTVRLADVDTGDWRGAMDVALEEYLAMKRTMPGFSLVDFGNEIPVGSRDVQPNRLMSDRLAELFGAHLGREPDDELRRLLLLVVETADALIKLAFRVSPDGDVDILAEMREMLLGYLAPHLD